jgi:hypothetical protein
VLDFSLPQIALDFVDLVEADLLSFGNVKA